MQKLFMALILFIVSMNCKSQTVQEAKDWIKGKVDQYGNVPYYYNKKSSETHADKLESGTEFSKYNTYKFDGKYLVITEHFHSKIKIGENWHATESERIYTVDINDIISSSTFHDSPDTDDIFVLVYTNGKVKEQDFLSDGSTETRFIKGESFIIDPDIESGTLPERFAKAMTVIANYNKSHSEAF